MALALDIRGLWCDGGLVARDGTAAMTMAHYFLWLDWEDSALWVHTLWLRYDTIQYCMFTEP